MHNPVILTGDRPTGKLASAITSAPCASAWPPSTITASSSRSPICRR